MRSRREQLMSDIAVLKQELETYENCLLYALKYSVLGDIEHYGELRKSVTRRLEKAEDELHKLKTA